MQITSRNYKDGYTIVIVLILSLVFAVSAMALLQTAGLSHSDSQSRLYGKLAEEAAEAGAAYAQACLERHGRVQTWGASAHGGPRPDLTPSSGCDGSINVYPANSYVFSDDRLQTRFVIGDLEERTTSSVIISATGYTELMSEGVVVDTYTHIVKKAVVWTTDLVAQKSASATLRTCGLMSGDVYCWGDNNRGQLGDGTTIDSLVPVQLVRDDYPVGIGSYRVIDIVSGSRSNCLLIEIGEVYCWGDNNQGQLGNNTWGSSNSSSVPVKVQGLEGQIVVKLGVASNTMCALTSTGRLYCWGNNQNGQVGDGTTARRPVPVLIGGPSGGHGQLDGKVVTNVSDAGGFNNHMCAIADGRAYCWGRNHWGQLGNNPSGSGPWSDRRTPVAVYTGGALAGKTVFSISGDGDSEDPHTCAAAYTTSLDDAQAYCWGSHYRGNLGSNASAGGRYKVPVSVWTGGVMSGTIVTEITTTAIGGCVIAHPAAGTIDDSRAYCWGGHNTRGDGGSGQIVRPVLVEDTEGVFTSNRVRGIVGGAHRACAIVSNKAYCWGSNAVGQIGDGTTTFRSRPTESLFLRPRNNQYIF